MAIDPEDFGPELIRWLTVLKASGLTHASWTCVYDGDELATCSVDVQVHGKAWEGYSLNGIDLDETLLTLARADQDGETGSFILNLETRKLYHTSTAHRQMEIIETPIPTETADLSALDLRTQAERDY